jgi:hypothetical protein
MVQDPADDAVPQTGPAAWARLGIAVLAACALVHSVVLALWLAPSGPLRDSVGQAALQGYVNPYFGQSWSALAPNAQYVDEAFRVRAQVRTDGHKRASMTDWIDVTDAGVHATRGAWTQPRSTSVGRRLATNLNAAMFELSLAQRELIAAHTGEQSTEQLEQALAAMGNREAVSAYVAYDQMATRFASMYAASQFEGDIVRVQYLVGRRAVTGRGDDVGVRDKEFSWFTFGSRRPFVASYEQQLAFDHHAKVIS